MLKYSIMTLGCKVNQYEENQIAASFERAGFGRADFKDAADIYVINGCSITKEAENKAKQFAGRIKRTRPEAVVVLTGCYATRLAGEKIENIDVYVSQAEKADTCGKCLEALASSPEKAARFKDAIDRIAAAMPAGHEGHLKIYNSRARAQIKVQDGCKNFCSYCIVPYIRNNEWSKPPKTVLSEITDAVNAGYHEIVLTGIHLGRYQSADIYEKAVTFEDLLKLIDLYTTGLDVRVRLSSIDPSEITEKTVSIIKNSPAFTPHFHVPLQSGSDKILNLMGRKYDRKIFIEKIRLICDNIELPAISSDVIVGFPGETEEDFDQTYNLLSELSFYDFHIFPYSDRPGTRASSFEDKVPPAEKKRRSKILHELKKEKNISFYKQNIGRTAFVIPEKAGREKNGTALLTGHTERYIETAFQGRPDMVGKIIKVKLEAISESHDGMTGSL